MSNSSNELFGKVFLVGASPGDPALITVRGTQCLREAGLVLRGAEEVEILEAAGIPYEVVPGVTAAFAAASHAGIPLTHREAASFVIIVREVVALAVKKRMV